MATVTSSKRQLTHTSNTYESNGDVTIGGNLNINGTTTTIDTANLLVEDKNIIIGDVSSPSDSTADGGGITLKGASDKTINWVNSTDSWTSNQRFSAPSLTLTSISATSGETSALLINSSNHVVKRTLGSNAFNSTSFLTGNQTITLSGDVSGSGTTSISVTVADDSHNHVISNVDGLQSALDGKLGSSEKAADSNLLDNIDSTRFIYGGTATGTTSISGSAFNPSGSLKSGFYRVAGTSSTIPNATSVNFVLHTSYDTVGNKAGFDLAVNDSQSSKIYFRPATGGGRGSWQTIWTDSSDGSGSGLDADLLDGNHASAFATASHTHAASDITSGTLATARIPSLAASKITSGTFADARIASASNWNTAYTDRNKWDGGSTGLNASTGRASLGLGSAATSNTSAFAAAGDENIIDGATSIWNADGDGDVFTYNDSNPTHNNKGTGAVIYIRGDGSNDGGLVRAGIFTSDHVSTANGYYVGTLLGTTNSTTTQVINGSGEWTGNVIPAAKLSTATTQSSSENSTKIATTAYVKSQGYLTSANGGNAATLDGIDSTSFLRSDANDSFSGNLTNNGSNHITFGPNSTWAKNLRIGGNGHQGNSTTANIATTNGNLHLDAAVGSYGTYLNYYAGTTGVAFGNGASAAVAWMGPDGDLWKGSGDNSGSKYWHAGNDGSGSGLDADKLDAQEGSYYRNASNLNAGTVAAGRLSTATTQSSSENSTKIATTAYVKSQGYLTTSGKAADADKLDGVNGASYVRSDATDTITERITFSKCATSNHDTIASSSSSLGGLEIYNSGSGNDAFMAFHTGGDFAMYFGLDADNNKLSVGGWSMGANKYEIYHSGNKPSLATLGYTGETNATADQTAAEILTAIKTVDGSGSNLDADSTDGLHVHNTQDTQNSANAILRTQANGYTKLGWINTTSGNNGTTAISRIYASQDGYIRYYTPANFGAQIGSHISYNDLTNKPTIPSAYSLPAASSSTRGGVKIGYSENGKNYPVEVSSEKMFVNVPWTDTNTDTNTTYSAGTGISLSGTTFSLTDTASKLSLSGGTMTGTINSRDIKISSGYHLQRSNHHSGHLEGSYNNVGENSTKSNPIYTIGSSYNPTDAALSNMYGVGYTHTNASFISMTGASGWGMYVAADGDARVFLGGANGAISSTGEHYVGSSRVFHDTYHPNADVLTSSRTIALGGDVTGSASFNGGSNITISASLAAGSVGASEIAANAVGASEIAANAVGSSEIANNAVGAAEIANDAVGADQIAANAVGASELNVSGNGSTSQFLRSDGDGTFTWATPTDTNTNTTYSAGRGLDLSGTQFLLETDLRDSISYIGYDSNDYVQWSNNSYFRSVVNGSERFRVNTSGIDVTGTATANAFRTDTGNTDYNVFSRNSTSTTLWVQAAQSGSLQGIASFRYGSATVNQGTEVCAIRRNSSYFINTKLGVGTSSPSTSLDVSGTIRHTIYYPTSLPSASPAGQRAFAYSFYPLATSHGSVVSANGSYVIPVYSDGSSWRAG